MTVTTIRGAISNVKTWGLGVTGIAAGKSYDLVSFYQAAADGTLAYPCLLVFDELGAQSGWQSAAFQGNGAVIEFTLEHHFLHSAVGGSADLPAINDGILTLIDNYFAALKADPFFMVSGVPGTHTAATVSHQKQQRKWAETVYHAIVFRLNMRLYL